MSTLLMTDHDRCALLDPDAHVARDYQSSWSVTVPEGKMWWLLNAYYMIGGGSGNYTSTAPTLNQNIRWYHRSLDIADAMPLPGGTQLMAHPTSKSFALWCDPSLVSYDDPAARLAERRAKLATLPLRFAGVRHPAGGVTGTSSGVYFPDDFERGLILGITAMDVAWSILAGGWPQGVPTGPRATNIRSEISDRHATRQGGAVCFPFKRSVWDQFWICRGSVSGVPLNNNGSGDGLYGDGGVFYVALPADW